MGGGSPWPIVERQRFGVMLRHTLGQDPRPVVVVATDLDGFVGVSDRHGQEGVFAVLAAWERLIGIHVPPAAERGRVSGDEYWFVVAGRPVDDVVATFDRLRATLAATTVADGIRITTSIGIAVTTPEATTAETLVTRAEEALECAKESGRNRVVIFEAT